MKRLILALLAIVALSTPAAAWYKGNAGIPANAYLNACGTEPAGQNWCVGTDGWTVMQPTPGPFSGTCAGGDYRVTATNEYASCGIYISDTGTGTLSTCRVPLDPTTFSFTAAFSDSDACPATATNIAAVRNASSDFVLYKRTGCFIDPTIPTNPCTGGSNTTTAYGIATQATRGGSFLRTGLSAARPIVVAAYGPLTDARPKFTSLFNCWNAGNSPSSDHVAIFSIDCHAAWRDPRSAYYLPQNVGVSSGTGQQTISNVTASPTSPLIRVTISSTSDLSANPIYISGVGGVTAANGVWSSYTIIDATTVDLVGSTFSGTYTSGGNLGQRTMVVSNAVPSSAGTGDGFVVYNYSNAVQQRYSNGTNGIATLSLDGTRTIITLAQNIPAGGKVQAGDRIQFVGSAGGIAVTSDNLDSLYIEDVKLTVGAMVFTRQTNLTRAWTCNFIRNVVEYSYGINTRSQGTLIGDSFDMTSTCQVRENVVDGSGWMLEDMDCVPGAVMPAKCNGVASPMIPGANGYVPDQSHNHYSHEWCCLNSYIGNILTNATGVGAQLRAGGNNYNNFSARNSFGMTGGGIMHPNNVTYSVFAQIGAAYSAISKTSAASSGTVLTFVQAPNWLQLNTNLNVLNANTGVTVSRQVTAATETTITLNSSITVASGDTLYFIYSTPQTGFSAAGAGGSTVVGIDYPGVSSVVQWNIALDATPASQAGAYGGSGFEMRPSTLRVPGNVFSNNYVLNWTGGLNDQTQITSVDGTGCGGAIRLGNFANNQDTNYRRVGDTLTISGVAGIVGTVNGTFTVGSIPSANYVCLTGSVYTSGTWTAGTGVVNGGVAMSGNRYAGVATPGSTTQSSASFSSIVPAGTPTVEYCDTQLGGSGTLADFVNRAKTNRKGSWNVSYTANAMNNCIRSNTDPAIALQ